MRVSYDVKDVLGRGRYCTVRKGEIILINEGSKASAKYPCAIKALKKGDSLDDMADPTDFSLQAEMEILQLLVDCPHVIKYFGSVNDSTLIGQLDTAAFNTVFRTSLTVDQPPVSIAQTSLAIIELGEKGTIIDIIEQNPSVLTRKLLLKWINQLASVLEILQAQKIIHHDIKPHNVLLDSNFDVKVADFGNALFCSGESLQDGLGKGTLGYQAPEIFSKERTYSFPVDVYSLGVLIYALVSNDGPFASTYHAPTIINYIRKGFWSFHRPPGYHGDIVRLGSGEELVDDDIILGLMFACTEKDPKDRPTPFKIKELSKLL
jgi:serine/threonine protein kinase